MSIFNVPVVEIIAIEPIPGADAIELAVVGDYRSVIKKDQFKVGDKAVYLPEQAVLPTDMIVEMDLVGKLAGHARNRIKAIRLRGCLSQGILYPATGDAVIGECQAERLGITKYEPSLPQNMASSHLVAVHGNLIAYDFENFKKYPSILETGEEVEFTEKLHGTFCGVAIDPEMDNPLLFDGNAMIYSKGYGAKGFCFMQIEENLDNLYVENILKLGILAKLRERFPGQKISIFGEIYGAKIQDLTYGLTDTSYAVFDIYVGAPHVGRWLNRDELARCAAEMEIQIVPSLYRGPFSREKLYEYTTGKTTIAGASHIREGIVVRPIRERRDNMIGRVILKSVSGDYLTRKGEVSEYA
jgi:RNA ligase (TIGR02306 family)